jgi:RNA polymerase sigma factor (sigma-70 family)
VTNKIKTNLDYIRLVEHWQSTESLREKNIVEESIIKSGDVDSMLNFICRKFSRDGKYPMEDLMQEASIGVLKAITKWDTKKAGDTKFTSYMVWWVNSQIYNFLSKNCGDVHVPKKNLERMLKDIKESGEPSEKTVRYATSYVYLDKPRPDGEEIDSVLYNEYGVYSINSAVIRDKIRDTEKIAAKALDSIKDDSLRDILYRRCHGDTLQDIGTSMKLSRERIRQLETRALGILRNNKDLMKEVKEWTQ